MWVNSVRQRFWRNIILALLSVSIIAGLVYMMIQVKHQNDQEDAALSEISTQRKQEQDAVVAESYQSFFQEYEKDLEAIQRYLPGIVCWGDTLTKGSSGNVSYPDVLESLIQENICDCYDFSENIPSNVVYSELADENFTIEIPVVNMGGGNENSDTILGRAGSADYYLLRKVKIPGDCTPVVVSLCSEDKTEVTPLTVGDTSINPVTIDGVEGTLALDTSSSSQKHIYTFTRTAPGEEIVVKSGTPVICSNVDVYSNYIHVIWIGTYDNYYKPEALVQNCKALLQRQTENSDRFLIIAPCSFNGSWDMKKNPGALDNLDAAMLREFGDHYISLRKYLVSDGLTDVNMKATAADERASVAGSVPVSLRSANGTLEFSSKVYESLGRLVYERMLKLGYFSEICEELNITPGKQNDTGNVKG